MSRKTWILLKRGILKPKHRLKVGIRIWLYLYMLDRANWEQGAVLEWRDESEAEELEMEVSTLRLQRRQLEADGYIRCEQTQRGQRVTILKWVNPREYSGKVYHTPDMAGIEEGQGVKSLTPSDAETIGGDSQGDNQGGGQGGGQGDSQGVKVPTPPLKESHGVMESGSHGVRESHAAASPAALPSRDQTLFVQALAILRQRMDRAEFSWVEVAEVASVTEEGEALRLALQPANVFARARLHQHRSAIEAAIASVAGRPATVTILEPA